MYDLSVSNCPSLLPNMHKSFRVEKVTNMKELTTAVCQSSRWSPIIWEEGLRRSENFLYSDFAVFDFDNGIWTIEHAKKFCNDLGFWFFIYPTKNHRKSKNGSEILDRFRMIFPWEHRITSLDAYTKNLDRIAKEYGMPCDPACKDGARMYAPSRNLFAYGIFKKKLQWIPYVKPNIRRNYLYAGTRIIPQKLKEMMAHAPQDAGERNSYALKMACWFLRLGFNETETLTLILGCMNLPEKEVRDVITGSARRYAGKR